MVDAYAQLSAEGYLTLRQGARPRVCEAAALPSMAAPVRPEPAAPRARFDFRPSVPDVSTFPRAAWLRSLREALTTVTDADLGYGDPRGVESLRSALADYLGRARGVVADPANIVVFPYAFRHSFAQRHADNGTPIDVLATMMGHRTIDTTRGYYKVNKARMRKAVARVSEMQLNHRGNRVGTGLAELVDAEYDRYQVGQIAVSFGTCHEPSNVKSSGQSCPYRYRCFGCTHFRTDPSYLPELREHLQRLLADHERLNAATDGMLEDWARRDAMPAPEEVVAVGG